MMDREHVRLEVRQQPERAQVVPENGNKNRKAIDPPPIVELKYDARNDQYNKEWLVSPRLFMMVELYPADEERQVQYLSGQLTSSLHKLKEYGADKDGGYFIFGDVSVKKTGTYKLRFHLFDTAPCTGSNSEGGCCAELLQSIDSGPFEVKNSREFGPMSESTSLTKTFSDQGVKLRVRKQDPRATAGQKRSYVSPEASPNRSSYMSVGGAVQDAHYNSPHHASKRHRSQSDAYEHSPYYMAGAESYGGGVRGNIGSTPSWTGSTVGGHHSRGHSYSHQPSSMNYSLSRMPTATNYITSSTQSWQQPMHSALPSPASSTNVGGHQQASPTYPSGTPQATTQSSFGDPGLAHAMPMGRNSYYGGSSSGYGNYASNAQYQPQAPADAHQSYSDLQLPGTSLTDTSAIVAPDQAYNSTYIFGSEATEVSGGYASYMGDTKF